MKIAKILYKLYSPIAYRCKRYKKAAKKNRIMKKWLNRFGPDTNINDLAFKSNPFLTLAKESKFCGGHVPLDIEENKK